MGIDPGLASGVAIWNSDGGGSVLVAEQTENGVLGLAPRVLELIAEWEPDHIVWESFTLRAGNKFLADLSGVESIGWAKAHGLYQNHVAPSVHKTFSRLGDKQPKAKSPLTALMKRDGFPIGAGHARDALSVAFHYDCTKLKTRSSLELHQQLTKGK